MLVRLPQLDVTRLAADYSAAVRAAHSALELKAIRERHERARHSAASFGADAEAERAAWRASADDVPTLLGAVKDEHTAAIELLEVGTDISEKLEVAKDETARLHLALQKISDIRDSIIGHQNVNWSEHIYPLVAALKEAGFKGTSYQIAKENIGTLHEEITQLRNALEFVQATRSFSAAKAQAGIAMEGGHHGRA